MIDDDKVREMSKKMQEVFKDEQDIMPVMLMFDRSGSFAMIGPTGVDFEKALDLAVKHTKENTEGKRYVIGMDPNAEPN